MKEITMFMTKWCPYCRRAIDMIGELQKENEQYGKLKITMIDENKDRKLANQYDYYLVPTFYIDGTKIHEGAASKEDIRKVFDKAV